MSDNSGACCETCVYYVFDDDWESYVCEINLDEDDMSRFYGSGMRSCPFYRYDDEYGVVRKQN